MVARPALRDGPRRAAHDGGLPRRAWAWLGHGNRRFRDLRDRRSFRRRHAHPHRSVPVHRLLRGDGLPGLPAQERRRGPELPGPRSRRRHPASLAPLLGLLRRATRRQPERHAHKHVQHRPRRLDARLWLRALGELAIPIGLHITWNFFQGAIYGFPVSGFGAFSPTLLTTEQGGPDLWTGGSFGPEGGLLVPSIMLLGMSLVALWTHLRTGKVSLHT